MPAAASAEFLARLKFDVVNQISAGLNSPVNVDIPGVATTSLPNGTGAGQINLTWADRRTYSATPTTHDLSSLVAAATNTGAAAFVKGAAILLVNNEAANSGKDMTVGNAASNQFLWDGLSAATTTFTVKAGCSKLITDLSSAGMPVSGTAKSAKFDPGAANIDFTIVIVGRS